MGYIHTDNYNGIFPKYSSQFPLFYPKVNGLLPRVSSTKEVEDFPMTSLNTEEVYLNKEDDTVLYIKRIDTNGKCTTTRYRFYPDPEPTQQQINDERYVTIDQFKQLKEDILNTINQNKFNGRNKNNGSKPTNENVRNSEN